MVKKAVVMRMDWLGWITMLAVVLSVFLFSSCKAKQSVELQDGIYRVKKNGRWYVTDRPEPRKINE